MAREAKFRGTFGLSPQPVAGVTLYQDRRAAEPSIEDMLEELEKSEIRDARKEEVLAKLRERIASIGGTKKEEKPTQNPKRYLVDPETGVISVDEEEGELTYKDALLISASRKSKGGHYDEAIQLINTAKTLAEGSQPKTEDKKKEFYIDQETGLIVRDEENGEYTLSEARAISQSIQKAKAEPNQPPPNYYVDSEGNLHKLEPGQPAVVKQQSQPQPPKTYVIQPDGKFQEHQTGEPIIVKIEPPSNPSNLPALGLDKDGNPLFRNFDELVIWKRFEAEEKRADENHQGLMEMIKLARENIPPGVQAFQRALSEQGASGQQPRQAPSTSTPTHQCENCGTAFGIPGGEWAFLACPGCGKQYSREELLGSSKEGEQ